MWVSLRGSGHSLDNITSRSAGVTSPQVDVGHDNGTDTGTDGLIGIDMRQYFSLGGKHPLLSTVVVHVVQTGLSQ